MVSAAREESRKGHEEVGWLCLPVLSMGTGFLSVVCCLLGKKCDVMGFVADLNPRFWHDRVGLILICNTVAVLVAVDGLWYLMK